MSAEWMSADPFLRRLDLLLLVPLAITVVCAGAYRYFSGAWAIRKAIVLGCSLPLAIIYTIALWKPSIPNFSVLDNLSRQVSTLIVAPQIVILYPIGIGEWLRLPAPSPANRLSFPVTIVVAILGHAWTMLVLSAL